MKKLIAALAVCLMILCLLTACANNGNSTTAPQTETETGTKEETPESGVANPLVETDADGVMQQLGFALGVPDDAENVQYFILNGDTEELHFTLNGLDYDALKNRLSSFLGTKVQMTCTSKGKGKITIPFGSEDDLLRLMGMFDKMK